MAYGALQTPSDRSRDKGKANQNQLSQSSGNQSNVWAYQEAFIFSLSQANRVDLGKGNNNQGQGLYL